MSGSLSVHSKWRFSLNGLKAHIHFPHDEEVDTYEVIFDPSIASFVHSVLPKSAATPSLTFRFDGENLELVKPAPPSPVVLMPVAPMCWRKTEAVELATIEIVAMDLAWPEPTLTLKVKDRTHVYILDGDDITAKERYLDLHRQALKVGDVTTALLNGEYVSKIRDPRARFDPLSDAWIRTKGISEECYKGALAGAAIIAVNEIDGIGFEIKNRQLFLGGGRSALHSYGDDGVVNISTWLRAAGSDLPRDWDGPGIEISRGGIMIFPAIPATVSNAIAGRRLSEVVDLPFPHHDPVIRQAEWTSECTVVKFIS